MPETPEIIQKLQSPIAFVRADACDELRRESSPTPAAIAALEHALSDQNEKVREAAAAALAVHRPAAFPAPALPLAADTPSPSVTMRRELRSWALLNITIGILSLIPRTSMSQTWGVMLIVAGIITWLVNAPVTFVLIAVIMGLAALSNAPSVLFGGGAWLLGAAALQVYWTILLFRKWKTYRRALPAEPQATPPVVPIAEPLDEALFAKRFSVASLALGVLALLALAAFAVAASMHYSSTQASLPESIILLFFHAVEPMASLGVALSIAAALSGGGRKAATLLGLALGIVGILAQWLLLILAMSPGVVSASQRTDASGFCACPDVTTAELDSVGDGGATCVTGYMQNSWYSPDAWGNRRWSFYLHGASTDEAFHATITEPLPSDLAPGDRIGLVATIRSVDSTGNPMMPMLEVDVPADIQRCP